MINYSPIAVAADHASSEITEIEVGDRGKEVEEVQEKLQELHYYHGAINGLYTDEMIPAVWAFQKVQGIELSKTIGTETLEALSSPVDPTPIIEEGRDDRVEIDLTSQLMQVWQDGEPFLISHISSGSGAYYCSDGRCRYATTPTGDFKVYKKIDDWETAPLGEMYRPLYFYGGFAIHGSTSVPLRPESHGCIRVPMSLANLMADTVEVGWPVHLRRL
ncbi:L,D-transpeptidase family protein [Streptomyces sp. NPDC003038]|uniref:L,D-transpeptidase family protein n=1 Tax=unclassified Streptomyces TaxID=2593676 RepID=UPI0033AD70A2